MMDNSQLMEQVLIENELYFKISDSNKMRPFFMSIVSDSNHWMFIASNGGLTAGRKNSDYALFPYYTDDKITESSEISGSKSIFIVTNSKGSDLWEPFSLRQNSAHQITRNLYKNSYGNKIIFEEVNHTLGVTFSYQWCTSDQYGFIKKSKLTNQSSEPVQIKLLDGIQNIMPYGVSADLQNQSSNLVDAYKRTELEPNAGIAIIALSAIIVDKAEPSEALKANVAWSLGLNNSTYLLSSKQLQNFRNSQTVLQETDIKAEKGSYFVVSDIKLESKSSKNWSIIADVNLTQSAIINLSNSITSNSNLQAEINSDIDLGTEQLIKLCAASDGLQLSNDKLRDTRHFSNTLFNIMRGGIFDDNYTIDKQDFVAYLANANKLVFKSNEALLKSLNPQLSLHELKAIAYNSNDTNFKRLCLEYMPLKFSRRHGDPSRPWNKFSINTKSEIDGSKILDYEGNWRDIFQNWEALVYAYPEFIESMISKFLNASTFDGYNPYRITKSGIDWETIEEDNPWSYIGYWGDHQIIYLLKFLEFAQNHYPGKLQNYFSQDLFVYANVPYKIKSYTDIQNNPKDTIEFDHHSQEKIQFKIEELGADGVLLTDENQTICKVNFIEKILATVLAKVSNFVPEAGIWLNTQRPEWNDANNALVGNGVSMVTLYYLRRFLNFMDALVQDTTLESVEVSEELALYFNEVHHKLTENQSVLNNAISDKNRKNILDAIAEPASQYRQKIYTKAFSGKKLKLKLNDLSSFFQTSLKYFDHSINANKRTDNLYHAYNLITFKSNNEVSVSYLNEMLEGQVSVLSSGYLTSNQALSVLDGLKASALFRHDQYSYILYPNTNLPSFLQKNNIPKNAVASSKLLTTMLEKNNTQIIEQDLNGNYHFNGNFNNVGSLKAVLNNLKDSPYASLAESEKQLLFDMFEQVFNHKAFTGRSGTFFGYEGLGSIYWHMVSKLHVAVQECCIKAINENESDEIIGRLLEHYYEIYEGIGVHKSPQLYGAFPTDPYSHTPEGKGAQQPGMTGQVKEDILTKIGELGVFVNNGQITFNPILLRKTEFLQDSKTYTYVDVNQNQKQINLNQNELAFTYCQIPVIYKIATNNSMIVEYSDTSIITFDTLTLDTTISEQMFKRMGGINKIEVSIQKSILK